MKIELIKLTENNVPDVEVIAFGECGKMRKGYVIAFGGGFSTANLEFKVTHFIHIPNLSDNCEPINPNQSIIDEYRGLIEEQNKQIYGYSSECDGAIIRERINNWEEFITKLTEAK